MLDDPTSKSSPLATPRAQLEELFQGHDRDPRGIRAELAKVIKAARHSSQSAERACLGPALAMDSKLAVRLGRYDEGLELSAEALRCLADAQENVSEVRAANAHAEALMHLSRLDEARDFLHERVARAEARDELHGGHITLFGNLAAVSFYAGVPAGALQPLARALELATSLGDEQRRALVLGNFGNLYGQLEDHAKSLDFHQQCADILRGLGAKRHLANCLHNIGVQQDRLGDPEQALATFAESLELRDEGDDLNRVAKTELDRAYSLVHLERFDEAEVAIERALELHRESGGRRQEARALTSLANLEHERKRFPEAIARFEQSQRLLDELGAGPAGTNNRAGIIESYLAMEDSASALEVLEAVEEFPPSGAPAKRDAHMCELWMRTLELCGQPERAFEHAKRRIEILEELHAADAERAIGNLQGIHKVELLRQRERDQVRVRGELEALIAERARQLMETNAELEARVDELVRAEYMRSKLEEELRQAQKMDAIGRLAGGVAHDFNNLLTVILGRGELLFEEIDRKHPGHESLREIMEAASRAARLTVQLLAFGRKQALKPTLLDVEVILNDLQRMLARLLGERITVSVESQRDRGEGAGPLCVLADRGQLEQVFINLAINARDAMPRGGELTFLASRVEIAPPPSDPPELIEELHALPPGSYISIRVSDTGEGMTDEFMERVFEPFFTTKELGKGTGLGLSTVHGIVHQSGGTITVTSTRGAGSTFDVLLPATSEEPAPEKREEQSSETPSTRRTVLVVEDDAGLRRVMREGLGRRGYDIIEASDGTAAIGLAREVDIVICDRVLPKLGGPEVLAALRANRPNLPCLMISGHPTSDDEDELLDGVRFLSKPFKLEALLRVLQELLQDSPGEGDSEEPRPTEPPTN